MVGFASEKIHQQPYNQKKLKKKESQFCPTQSSLKRGGKTSVTFQEVKANEKFKNHITLITSNIVSF